MIRSLPEGDSPKSCRKYTFTVFTATHNRAHTLYRAYESLKAQTFRDFEWLVVDDGSTDDTESLIMEWSKEADFPIRYIRQSNRGKHVALNRGVQEAKGRFFLILDSDDGCVPEALERLKYHWDTIPEEARNDYVGVTALCMDQYGKRVGSAFPSDVMDSDALEIRYKHKVQGEKWGFLRTDVLKEYPFPEPGMRTYVPESIVWSQMARKYKTRFVNEELRIYWMEGPSLVHGQRPAENAEGGRLQHQAVLNSELDWFWYAPVAFLRSAVHYVRFSLHAGVRVMEQARSLRPFLARILWTAALPLGYVVFVLDRHRAKEGR